MTFHPSPEFRVLAAGVGAAVGGREAEAPAEAVDWETVVQAARAHRCQGLLYRGLAGHAWMPQPARDRLAGLARANLQAGLAQVAATTRLVRLLEGEGIRCLMVKGVVLSQLLYGDPARRGAGDVDVLVEPARFWDADALLRRAGYRPFGSHPVDARARDALGAHVRDLQYLDPAGGFIELHQRLTANAHRVPADFEALWAERQQVMLAGTSFDVLPRRVLPLYLCVHGAYHCWERLCWLADLAVLLQDPADAAAALVEAEAAGLAASLRLALTLSHRLLGLPAQPPGAPADADRFLSRFYAGPDALAPPKRGTARWLRRELWRRHTLYGLKPGWRHVWQEMRADMTNTIDLEVLRLPSWASPFYPLLRPLGWLLRNFRK